MGMGGRLVSTHEIYRLTMLGRRSKFDSYRRVSNNRAAGTSRNALSMMTAPS